MPDTLHLESIKILIVKIPTRDILQYPGRTESHVENATCVIHLSATDSEATCSGDSPVLYLKIHFVRGANIIFFGSN